MVQTFDFNAINTEGQANDAALRRQQGSSLTWGDPSQKSPSASVPDSTSFASARPYLPLIQRWFNPGDVGKTVWTGFFESGFDTTKKATDPGSDGATGIFRIQNLPGRPSPDALTDPELNTKYASYLAYRGAAQGIPFDQWTGPKPDQKARYTDWGDEGATYHNPVTGKDEPFGALQVGAHPYPGDANVNLPPHPLPDDYHDRLAETQVIIPMLNQSQFDQTAAIKAFQDDPNNYTTQKRQFEIGSEGEFNARRSGMSDKQIFDIETAPPSQRIPTPEAQAKLASMQKQLVDTISETQRQTNFQVGLNILPALINNPATGNIKDYDSLYSYLDSNKQRFNVFGDQKGNPLDSLSQNQKDYLAKTISTLAPYLNKPGQKPLDQNQMTQFLAAVTTVPDSRRISIASLSSDSIKALLTTRPGGNLTLPQGLTEDALRRYYASDQFASPEAQKSISDLQGQAKNLIDSWVRQDNQYAAIKTGLLDPMSLPILQTKAQGIGAWTTGLLSWYSKNVPRPLATMGLIGVNDVNNFFKSLVPDVTIPGTNIDLRSIPGANPIKLFGPMGFAINYADTIAGPLLDKIGIPAPLDNLQSKFNQNRSNGQNIWEAAGNGFDQWQANGIIKMVAETAYDPLTYLGFGVYSDITKGIPFLGPTVAAIEDGAKIAFENPIVARTALSVAGAGIGYSITGDWRWAAVGAAVGQVPSLRAVPLFTEGQLVHNAIDGEGGLKATLSKAFSVFNHVGTPEGLSLEQLQDTMTEGLRQVSIDPAMAHMTEEGQAARAMLHYTSPEITQEEISGWVSAARDEAPIAGRMFTAPEVNLETLKDVNYNYDLLLGAKTGILNPAEAADNIVRILGLPPEAGPIIADKLSARIDAGIEGVNSLMQGSNANSVAENMVKAAHDGYLKQIRSPLYQHGRFQGYVLGLENSLKPVTKTSLWKFMAGVQTAITRSQLMYLSFGIQHIAELPFRSLIAGAGLNLEINADREGEALLFHGWNTALPLPIRNHTANALDLVAGVGKEAPIADSVLAKDRNAFQTLKDWMLLPNGMKERIYANTKAAAYNHFVVDEVARAAPKDFLSMKNSIDSIIGDFRDAKFQPEDIESLRKTLVNFSFRPDAPELLRRMAGDIPSLERRATLNEAQSIMDKYTNVDSPYKSYLMKGLQRGEWNPEQIIQNIEDVKNSMLEHEVAKSANYAQALKEYSQTFIDTINGMSAPFTGADIPTAIGELNKAREAVADATSDILSSATERAHSINGEENISKHWERSNKALSDYVESTTDNLAQMTDAVRQHLGEVNPDVADIASKALDSLQQRIDLINSTRTKSDAVITDWIAAHGGERPRTSAVWDNLIAQRKLIWDDHWTQESRLLKTYQQLVGQPIYDAPAVASNGLTVQHLANFYHSSGDELAQSMVHLQSIMRKEQFVATVGGDVQGAALRARTTQDALGWSDKAIGDLYDQIRTRMNTNPADSPTLLVSKSELDNMRQDLLQLQINKGYSPAQATTVEEAFNKHANFMEQNPFDQQDITKAYEQAHLRHSQAFIDYSHENVFDAAIKAVYPFWVHQATRWPWLAGTVLSHPGVGTFLGRYQDYTDKGYVHFPGQDMAFNLLRGNSLMGGFGGLVASSPASYEDGAKGMLGQAYDSMGKAGFFPGFWATLPLNLTGHVGFQLPSPIDTAINATGWAGNQAGIDTHILNIRDYLFPSKFRDYYTTEIVASLSQERNLGYSGEKVRRDIESGNADDTEKALWAEAQAKMAGYQTLFDQVGVFKLDPEGKRAANREAAQFIYEKTGVTPDQQDAMSTKLGASGLRLSDVLPLDPASAKQLYEMSKFKYWAGLSNVLQPSELQKTQDKISDFWDEVNKKEDIGKTVGFTTSNGTKFESLDSLDQQFRSGQITAKDWNQKQAATRQQISAEIEGLKKSNQFKDTPISLEDRQAWAQKNGTSVPVEHPAKELLNMYYSITPKTDPTTGTPNWDDYFASIDGLLNTLPSDKKSYLLDYIQQKWSPTQKLYWQANSTYLRPYNNLREGILDALDPAQSTFIRAHQGVSPADIDNLPPNEQKLMKDYSSALSNAETRYRELSPQTDAWLYYWGKSGTLETEAARADYNSLTQRYGGPKPLEVPIDESKKRNLLPSLP